MENEKTIGITSLIQKATGISILYVEDEQFLRENTTFFLKKIFTSVDVAVDGKEGLEKYTNSNYDIVITDILMPNMSGLELIHHMHTHNEKQAIIIISGDTEHVNKDQSINMSVIRFITKPICINNLVDALCECIDSLK